MLKFWFWATLIFFTGLNCAARENYCKALLESARQQVMRNLEYEPRVQADSDAPLDARPGSRRMRLRLYHPTFNILLAELDYTIYDRGTSLRVERIDVFSEYNMGKGLSYLLYSYLFLMQPDIRQITTY